MNLNPNGTMFLSITTVDEATHRYMVCLHATPPHIVSDGLWGSGATNRKPVKSFLPLFELRTGPCNICHIPNLSSPPQALETPYIYFTFYKLVLCWNHWPHTRGSCSRTVLTTPLQQYHQLVLSSSFL